MIQLQPRCRSGRSFVLVALTALSACSTQPDPGDRSHSAANNGTTNGTTTPPATCDPLTEPSCRLELDLTRQPCLFSGHAPGDVPSLSAGETTRLASAELVAAGRRDSGWIVATAAGQLLDEAGEVLADRSGSAFVDVAASATGLAFTRFDGERLVVEYRPEGGDWREVLSIPSNSGARVGGGVALDDAGILWVGVGDGGEEWAAADAGTLAGSILRLDVTQVPYGIPDDNPYGSGSSRRSEVWAVGMRDPRRCSLVGAVAWCSDQSETYSEINIASRAGDFGWPYRDGPDCQRQQCPDGQRGPTAFRPTEEECELLPGPLMPASFPDSDGARIYVGACTGRIWGVRATPDGVRQTRRVGDAGTAIVATETDGDAVVTLLRDGEALRWTFTDDADSFPPTLAKSGCLTEDGRFGDSLLPYDIAAPLWTDGAHKERYIALPPQGMLEQEPDGTLRFPDGTAILKDFSGARADGSRQRIETRVMRRRDGAWDFYTYEWRDGGAHLLSGGKDVEVERPDGSTYTHHIPSRSGCQSCHVRTKPVLGPFGPQLARGVTVDGHEADQLRLFEAAGVLEGSSDRAPLVDPLDESHPLQARARSYLHANCSHCHRPGGWAPRSLALDLRYDTPLAETGACEVPADFGRTWADGDLRIDPGNTANSNLLQRMLVDNPGRMPPLGTALIDRDGADVVGAWIDTLEGCSDELLGGD